MIYELNINDWKEYMKLRSQLSGFDKEISEEEFENRYSKMKGEIFVMKEGDICVASGRLVVIPKFHDNVGWIDDVVVDVKHRRKGFGKKIIEFLLNLAKEKGCYKVVLGTKKETSPFYKTIGMVKSGYEMTLFLE